MKTTYTTKINRCCPFSGHTCMKFLSPCFRLVFYAYFSRRFVYGYNLRQ